MSSQPQLVTLRPAPASEPPAAALSEHTLPAPIVANMTAPEVVGSAADGRTPAGDATTNQAPADTATADRSQADTATTANHSPADTATTGRSPIALRGHESGPVGSGPMTQGALALSFQVAPGVPAVPAIPPPPALRLVGPNDPAGALPDDLPDIYSWAPRLVQAVAEVITGDRPIGQLIRWTDSDVYADLHRRVRVLGLTTTATARGSEGRAVVRSVHVCYPRPEVAEIAAHVRHGGRSRAVAMRLEVHRDRWVCTALRLG